ncbi:MAG TPA: DUF2789 family protein [Candidatus Competibacteraceae bacterium]|nr:DUF2789 family protein [Candidatus Competibacteraceae bacterium]HQA24947.1 DUF2789 family protein [Candidatus Competibacteraceae bacterium]HQD54970.1 DUF2789 family protein [Candidatus Competibacteraceae bacterium]
MDTSPHNLSTLFEQLGLPSDASAITTFIHWHRPLDPRVALPHASWWTPAQVEFLVQALEEDSDWTKQVDELDALLRPNPDPA